MMESTVPDGGIARVPTEFTEASEQQKRLNKMTGLPFGEEGEDEWVLPGRPADLEGRSNAGVRPIYVRAWESRATTAANAAAEAAEDMQPAYVHVTPAGWCVARGM